MAFGKIASLWIAELHDEARNRAVHALPIVEAGADKL
jgi:hypothetical protein